jgi:mRNA-processing protein COX24
MIATARGPSSPQFDEARLRRARAGRPDGVGLGSVIKKRRKKMRKHKHKKMLKKTRWQRRAHA